MRETESVLLLIRVINLALLAGCAGRADAAAYYTLPRSPTNGADKCPGGARVHRGTRSLFAARNISLVELLPSHAGDRQKKTHPDRSLF